MPFPALFIIQFCFFLEHFDSYLIDSNHFKPLCKCCCYCFENFLNQSGSECDSSTCCIPTRGAISAQSGLIRLQANCVASLMFTLSTGTRCTHTQTHTPHECNRCLILWFQTLKCPLKKFDLLSCGAFRVRWRHRLRTDRLVFILNAESLSSQWKSTSTKMQSLLYFVNKF